jgi:hypothetical protein
MQKAALAGDRSAKSRRKLLESRFTGVAPSCEVESQDWIWGRECSGVGGCRAHGSRRS